MQLKLQLKYCPYFFYGVYLDHLMYTRVFDRNYCAVTIVLSLKSITKSLPFINVSTFAVSVTNNYYQVYC